VAIQPGKIAPGLELTEEIAAAVPRVIDLVLAELSDKPPRQTPDARTLVNGRPIS
jgi:hypothetical protein